MSTPKSRWNYCICQPCGLEIMKNTAFGNTYPYLRNMMSQLQKAVETSVSANSAAWNCWQHSFWGQIFIHTFTTWCANSKNSMKLVCWAIVRLGTNENTAFGDRFFYLRNMVCQLQKPLKLLYLPTVRLGNNEKHSFWEHISIPSQHDVSTPKSRWN